MENITDVDIVYWLDEEIFGTDNVPTVEEAKKKSLKKAGDTNQKIELFCHSKDGTDKLLWDNSLSGQRWMHV